MTSSPSPHHHPHWVRNTILTIAIVPITLFLALLIVVFVADTLTRSEQIRHGNYTKPLASSPAPTPTTYQGERKALIEGSGNNSFGTENPTVTIVEFSDFACPFCRASFPALREVSLKHQDTVKIIFRDWPGHEFSLPLALAAYCAGEQNKFWEMHDKLFQNQSDTFGSDKNQLATLAQQLGIYNEKFQSCFDTQKYLSQIRQNFTDSEKLEVQGTPTWFINGEKIEGQLSTTELEKLIAPYLK